MAAAAAALLAAGCTGGQTGQGTERTPPDRLTIAIEPASGATFAVPLDCAVADRETCAEVLEAFAQERDGATCSPIAGGGGSISVRGRIGGEEVDARAERRTDCEARLYDRVRAALIP